LLSFQFLLELLLSAHQFKLKQLLTKDHIQVLFVYLMNRLQMVVVSNHGMPKSIIQTQIQIAEENMVDITNGGIGGVTVMNLAEVAIFDNYQYD
jgi:hypothetical protein